MTSKTQTSNEEKHTTLSDKELRIRLFSLNLRGTGESLAYRAFKQEDIKSSVQKILAYVSKAHSRRGIVNFIKQEMGEDLTSGAVE